MYLFKSVGLLGIVIGDNKTCKDGVIAIEDPILGSRVYSLFSLKIQAGVTNLDPVKSIHHCFVLGGLLYGSKNLENDLDNRYYLNWDAKCNGQGHQQVVFISPRHGKSVVPKLLHAGTTVVVLKLAFQGTPIFYSRMKVKEIEGTPLLDEDSLKALVRLPRLA
ncbi:hypothetical protein C5167_042445 [Papaver somniferum]|uniref:Uncharacterized protein n=1 Tax=Papaver somniferum TaxID=3469 RepID=A0A4Y7L3W2_PAPSO|nr:hypothetical protein C5167_042445 [Papaver somniferum]